MIQGSFRRLMMRSGGSQLSDAAAFLATYGPFGMVMDFTDASISINDETDVLDYNSQGTVSSTTGALLGPGSLLTYSAPSLKFVEQADGYIAGQAHNLYLNSAAPANQSITVLSGGTYAVTITGSVSVTASGAATGTWTAGTNTFTAATGTLTLGSTSGSGTVHVRRTPSVSTYVATTGAIVYDLPYVYSAGVKTGIMVEPAATNLALNSGTLSGYTVVGCSVSSVSSSTPFGGSTCAKIAETSGGSIHLAFQSLTASAGNNTASPILKAAERTWAYVRCDNTSVVAGAYFNLATGTVGSVDPGITASIVSLGDGWYRCIVTASLSAGAAVNAIYPALANGTSSYSGTAGSGILVCHNQFEAGTVATSPIITYGSSVVRAVDTDTSLLNLFPSLGSTYTMYIRYKPASAAVATTGLRLDDTTANELVSIGNNASGQGLATVTDGGVPQASITSGTITSSAFHRLAVSVEANNVLFVVNGGTGVLDTSVTLPTLTRMLIGNTSGQLVAQLALLPGARTEAQLQAIGA